MDSSLFNGVLAKPDSATDNVPLLVYLHGGPYEAALSKYNYGAHFLLELGIAVLIVNYRGSTGMGDETLSAIMGNAGEVSL